MGNKSQARLTMIEAGVPVVPGTKEPVYDAKRGAAMAEDIGYPVMIKASSEAVEKGCGLPSDRTTLRRTFR